MAAREDSVQLRQRGPLNLGRNFVLFRINNCSRRFTVHEDLICTSSLFFKERCQQLRRPVEGECSICHEEIDLVVDDITFCRTGCGQNFHDHCIKAWAASQEGEVNCPLCRYKWVFILGPLAIDGNMDQQAVKLYIDWLYTGQLQIAEDRQCHGGDYHVFLLQAWAVSSILGDAQFKQVISGEYLRIIHSKHAAGVHIRAIQYAFKEQHVPDMRVFVMDATVATFRMEWFTTHLDDFPDGFADGLTAALIKSLNTQQTNHDLSGLCTDVSDQIDEDSSEGSESNEIMTGYSAW